MLAWCWDCCSRQPSRICLKTKGTFCQDHRKSWTCTGHVLLCDGVTILTFVVTHLGHWIQMDCGVSTLPGQGTCLSFLCLLVQGCMHPGRPKTHTIIGTSHSHVASTLAWSKVINVSFVNRFVFSKGWMLRLLQSSSVLLLHVMSRAPSAQPRQIWSSSVAP